MQLDTIYCGDNAEIMSQWPDCCVDLTVTSPPYDDLRRYNGYTWDFEAVAQQLYRVTKQGGVVVWVVGDATVNGSETGTSFRQALYFMGLGFNLHDTMIYQTDKPPLNHNRYEQEFEYMFVFSIGNPKAFNPIREGYAQSTIERRKSKHINQYPGDVNGKVKISKPLFNNPDGKMKGNTWYVKSGFSHSASENVDHPAIFPEALARDHILSWSQPGDTVLDCFCGSGTTLKQAIELDRHYIGIDISSEYCQLSQRRVDQARRPLFTF